MFGPLFARDTTISFTRARFAGLIVSAILSVGSLILAFYPGLNYGIDLRGGIAIVAHLPNGVDFQTLQSQLDELGLGPVELHEFGGRIQVSVRLQPGADSVRQNVAAAVREVLLRSYPGTTMRSVDAIGATASTELFRDGLIALGIALLVILGYIWIRFEWQFGVAGTMTLLLDMAKIVGLYALTQFQFNTTSIAAILTIMALSVSGKVVVYDRVRENLRLYRRTDLHELIDWSINETLSRTFATSATVFLAILPLAVLSGGDIRQFAMVLLCGIVIGTSSSIFVAAPVLLLLGRIRPKTMVTQEHAKPSL